MFSGRVGVGNREFDPLQVRYGGVVRGTFERHLMNLEMLLDRALASAPSNIEEERMAFAISEVLFKASQAPSVGLVHRVLGLIWGQYSTSDYMRRVIQLFDKLAYPCRRLRHSMALTKTSMLLRQERFEEAQDVTASYQQQELFNTNPLLLAMAGHVCYVLADAADDDDLERKEELKELAQKNFNHCLEEAEWHGFDEVVYLSVLLSLEQDDKEHAAETVETYRERNPGLLTAARFCVVFADDLDFGNERKLQAYMDLAKLDCSDYSVIDAIMELLPEVQDDENYDDICKEACNLVFKSLLYTGNNSISSWYYLTSFAAVGRLYHPSDCYRDGLWQTVFLSAPKKPTAMTEDKHTLAILKTHFCFYVFGVSSRIYMKWALYTHASDPSAADDPIDFNVLPFLKKPLIDL